jgi:hypothetical protein
MAVVVALAGGAGLAAAALMPWYAVNIGPPFSASTVSGWDATVFARIAMILGVVIAMAAAARLLGDRGILRLERPVRLGLAWVVMAGAVVALAMVAFRLIILPDPADLLSRQIGLYAAAAAGMLAVLGGIGMLAAEE